ncbi:MAG TPA: glycerophosphodiester phosphodiesterase family protein [Clostridia bacterium]|nr:glycerophosphodiester phosphodiesterase family protein [Clostridia bacterium]
MYIIAHRCGTDRFPELTVESALNSLKVGASFVEMDLRFTKDGHPVINHDKNAQALFGCDKNISEMDLNEFLSLRHKTSTGFSAHTLEDFFKAGV